MLNLLSQKGRSIDRHNLDQPSDTGEQGFFINRVAIYDHGLKVHHQQYAAYGIN